MHAGDLYLANSHCGACRDLYSRMCASGYKRLVRMRKLDEEYDAMQDFNRLRGGGTPMLITPSGDRIYGVGPILMALETAAAR